MARQMPQELLKKRFGELSPALVERIEELPTAEALAAILRVPDARSIDDLRLGESSEQPAE